MRGLPVRLVRAHHDACGQDTLVRVPRELPAAAIRVVVCGSCATSFECPPIEDVGLLAPSRSARAPRLNVPKLSLPSLRAPSVSVPALPAYAAVPLALLAIVGLLLLIQSGGSSSSSSSAVLSPSANPAAGEAAAAGAPAGTRATGKVSKDAQLVRGSNFTIALPPGWEQTTPASGATFAARAADGGADATLWVKDEPKLDFPTFEASSLAQLRTLAGSARVVSRVAAPTADETIVRLAADAPADQPQYGVTLRVNGPYRYYLATTLQPDAPSDASKGVDLLSNSLTPVAGGTAPPPATSGSGK